MKLIDEFSSAWKGSLAPPGCDIAACAGFGDLMWRPCTDSAEDFIAQVTTDPHLTVTGYSRWVALGRIGGEIRFYAAPIPAGAPPWWCTGEQPARVDAIKAEVDEYELGTFATVSDAVLFTMAYLAGARLDVIGVARATRFRGRPRGYDAPIGTG